MTAEVQADDLSEDASPCPKCQRWVPGTHELGVPYDPKPDGCGWCSHAARSQIEPGGSQWKCDVCGEWQHEDRTPIPKRFFWCESSGGGESCSFVATDLAHAKKILSDSGAEMYLENGNVTEDVELAYLDWGEYTLEAVIGGNMVWNDVKGPDGRHSDVHMRLADCQIGDWFTSEY